MMLPSLKSLCLLIGATILTLLLIPGPAFASEVPPVGTTEEPAPLPEGSDPDVTEPQTTTDPESSGLDEEPPPPEGMAPEPWPCVTYSPVEPYADDVDRQNAPRCEVALDSGQYRTILLGLGFLIFVASAHTVASWRHGRD